MDAITPLEASIWFSEIEKLLTRRTRIDGEAPDALFRKTLYLVQLAPEPLRDVVPYDIDADAVEGYLHCGAYAAAALALFAAPKGVTITLEVSAGRVGATVDIPKFGAIGEGSDKELAKALLGAWCKAILNVESSLGYAPLDDGPTQMPGLTH